MCCYTPFTEAANLIPRACSGVTNPRAVSRYALDNCAQNHLDGQQFRVR